MKSGLYTTLRHLFALQSFIYSSPAVANGFVYVGSSDSNLYAFGTRWNGHSNHLTSGTATGPEARLARNCSLARTLNKKPQRPMVTR